MAQAPLLRTLFGLSLVIAMLAIFGGAPLKAVMSTFQRGQWKGAEKNATAGSAMRTPVYFFSHGGVRTLHMSSLELEF